MTRTHQELLRCLAVTIPLWFALATGVLAQERPLALAGGTVHTVSGKSIAGGVVVMQHGKIIAVGRSVPDGAEQRDLSGRHLYPGLMDADSVLGLVEIGAVRATRDMVEVGEITPNVRAEHAVNPDSTLLPVARANGITYVRTAPRGGLIAGLSALIRLHGWTWEDLTVSAPLALQVEWPRMLIDRRPQARTKPKEQEKRRDERLRTLKEAFATARAYLKARDAASADHPVDVDARWEAMRPVLEGDIPVIVDADEITAMEAAMEWAEEEGVRLILSGGADAWRLADVLAEKDIPVILGSTLSMPRRPWEPYDTAYKNPLRLQEAGVRFCISGGGSSFMASNSRNLPYNAAMAESFGLPHQEALRSITLYPAQILGVEDRLGSVEVGKDATLMVTDGDPLDIRTQVLQVWIDGERMDLSNRHHDLYERYQQRIGGR